MRLFHAVVSVLSAIGLALVAPGPATAGPPADVSASSPVRLIVDTDFGQWWDDVAALAMVHAAADAGRVRILGMMSDVRNPWNAAGLDALNTWYGRPNIPIGVPQQAMAVDENYSRLLATSFPHTGQPEPALELYRRLLRGQPDHSVVILSIGALTNLAQLHRADPGLVARKVVRTVIMGGEYPRATAAEWNFSLDLAATRQVVARWPTGIVYDGFEVGARVFAGNGVCAAHPPGSPVRAAFDLLYGCGNTQAEGTWDPTAMHYALFGTDRVYRLAGTGGHNVVTSDGLNRWVAGGRHQRYLVLTDAVRLTAAIDELINTVPAGR